MAILKIYVNANVDLSKIHSEIYNSGFVTNFDGVNHVEGSLEILGDSIAEETSLDALIAAHDPSTNAIIPDVSPRQIRQALILSGISLQQIEDLLNSLEEPMKSLARVSWEYSTSFERYNGLVNQLGPALGLTSEQLDQLWITAGAL